MLPIVAPIKYWTVVEARAYLPRLRELVAVVHDVATVGDRASGNGRGKTAPTADVAAALAELEERSIVLRDPSTGLVDFPARGEDGVVYFLCYRLDEDDLEWWHLPEEGFPGRKRLPREPG